MFSPTAFLRGVLSEVFTPCRLSARHVFADCICAVLEKIKSLQSKLSKAISGTSGRIGGGVFFQRKRRKKAHRMVRPSVSLMNRTKANYSDGSAKRVFNQLHESHPSG
jgi:hypothetical protein